MKKIQKRILIPILALTVLIVGSSFSFKSDFFEIAKQVEIFTTLFKELNMNYVDETNPAELMDSAIKNMLGELDPYTVFLNEQDVEEYKIRNAGAYSGVGALIRSYKDKLVIIEPYKDYPADKAGLKAGDEIIKIGDIVVANFKEDAIDLMKGANNTSVTITYKRQGKEQTTTLTRSEIEIDAVPFSGMIDDKTGYVVLAKFNRKASSQTKDAIKDLKSQGAERIVLDLRGNPGGLLNEAIAIVNLFIPKGQVITTTKSKVKKFNKVYKTKSKALDTEIPLVVLVNGRSASASEIVSGALQDLDRAVVIGARSFGKGLVQRPMRLTYGTQLKVTISRYYTPSGRCIQSLDYWNRDREGKAVKTKTFNEFKTKNGRKVFDGGGVLPDIEVASQKTSAFSKALQANNVVFDYATNYFYSHNITSISDFNFDDASFTEFKNFVKNSGFSYETKTEKQLHEIMNTDEGKGLNASVQEKYKGLLAAINKGKLAALDEYKGEIAANLKDEIVKRYFYREGLYNYYLKNDETILLATELLANKNKYEGILK